MEIKYPDSCTRYSVFEVAVKGPSTGNPFTEQSLKGVFSSGRENKTVRGFYDGDGIYRIRFMPMEEGMHSFVISGTFLDRPLSGRFFVDQAEEGCHGPVRVIDTTHFAYADGTPYVSVGTTCYVWHLQDEETKQETLHALEEAGFNKIRFCIFPKHYVYNFKDPSCFPYEGTPMDASVLTEENFSSYTGKTEGNNWDFTRFNPVYFQNIETCIKELGKRGIEADLIIMHPYDRWGFSSMPREADDLYYHYIINRFSAFANVWWSLANEYDLMQAKTNEDWEHYGELLLANDPYQHLRSIHNCRLMYDHSRPWITHCSIQRVDLYKGAELTDEFKTRYNKPVVMDEIAYEGNLPLGWGNITAEEMVRRMWETAMRGGYPGHSETYLSEDGIIWWSHGGTLKGESAKRMNFLKEVMSSFPAGEIAFDGAEWDCVTALPEKEWFVPVKSVYVYYFSFMRPSSRSFHMPEGVHFHAEVIDTWNMTIEDAGVVEGSFTIALPARQYMAIRLTKTDEECREPYPLEVEEEEAAVEETDEGAYVIEDELEEEVVEPVEETPEETEEAAVTEEPVLEEETEVPEETEEEEPVESEEETEEEKKDFLDVYTSWQKDGYHNNDDTDELPEFLTGKHRTIE